MHLANRGRTSHLLDPQKGGATQGGLVELPLPDYDSVQLTGVSRLRLLSTILAVFLAVGLPGNAVAAIRENGGGDGATGTEHGAYEPSDQRRHVATHDALASAWERARETVDGLTSMVPAISSSLSSSSSYTAGTLRRRVEARVGAEALPLFLADVDDEGGAPGAANGLAWAGGGDALTEWV